MLSDYIKEKFKLIPGSHIYNFVDKLGGINLSRLLGYKPFTIKFGYAVTPNDKVKLIDLDVLKNVKLH